MKRILLLIILVSLITSCSKESKFDKSMSAGRDALIANNFEEAIHQFDIALIEEPNDKDAVALFERAKKSLAEQEYLEKEQERTEEMKLLIDDYLATRQNIYDDIVSAYDSFNDGLTNLEKEELPVKISEIRDDLKAIIDTERDGSGILRYSKQIGLDNKLESALSSLESSILRTISNPNSKYNDTFVNMGYRVLESWKTEVSSYK